MSRRGIRRRRGGSQQHQLTENSSRRSSRLLWCPGQSRAPTCRKRRSVGVRHTLSKALPNMSSDLKPLPPLRSVHVARVAPAMAENIAVDLFKVLLLPPAHAAMNEYIVLLVPLDDFPIRR